MPSPLTHIKTRLRNLDKSRAALQQKQAALDLLVGKHLRQMRLDHRLSLATVSAKANISITNLWEIERGVRNSAITLPLYNKLEKAIRQAASQLATRED